MRDETSNMVSCLLFLRRKVMIRLEIDEYCQDCPHFTADVQSPAVVVGGKYIGDTIVSCVCKDVCKHVSSYYRTKLKEESDGRKEM